MRKYKVKIMDLDGKILIEFNGLVTHKKQKNGRLIGNVDEELYCSSFKIEQKNPSKILFKHKWRK